MTRSYKQLYYCYNIILAENYGFELEQWCRRLNLWFWSTTRTHLIRSLETLAGTLRKTQQVLFINQEILYLKLVWSTQRLHFLILPLSINQHRSISIEFDLSIEKSIAWIAWDHVGKSWVNKEGR